MVKPYTFKGLRPDLIDRSEHKAYEKKSGPGREAPAQSGHSSGPISGSDVTLLREGIGGLTEQGDDTPVGDNGVLQLIVDEHGRRFFYGRFKIPGTTEFDWYRMQMWHPEDPGISIGGGGGIDVGDVATERPITIRANNLYPPLSGSGASTPVQIELPIGPTNLWFMDFDQSPEQFAEVSIVVPAGYGGGPMVAFFYWYVRSAGGGTTAIWTISAKTVDDGGDPDFAWPTAVSVTDTRISLNKLMVSAATPEFTPAGEGGEVHKRANDILFRISRNGGSNSTPVSLNKVVIYYGKDLHSDPPGDVGTPVES